MVNARIIAFMSWSKDTIRQGFDYQYFALKGGDGDVRAIQPFFILEQDLLGGLDSRTRAMASWPGACGRDF